MEETIKKIMDKKILNDLTLPKAEPVAMPELTDAIIKSAIPMLLEVEKYNGYLGIAMELGVTQGQVKEIHEGMQKRIAELQEV